MHIAIIAPPWLPVPAPAYGGTEVVLDQLAQGLQRAGHDVLMICHPKSECPVPKASQGLSEMRGNPEIPPKVRSVGKTSRLPVRILWA